MKVSNSYRRYMLKKRIVELDKEYCIKEALIMLVLGMAGIGVMYLILINLP